MAKGEARQNQWPNREASSKLQPKLEKDTSNPKTSLVTIKNHDTNKKAERRSGLTWDIFKQALNHPNVKGWSKSRTKVTSYKSSWNGNEPPHERYVETEWDDDVPVKQIVKDSAWDNKEQSDKSYNTWDDEKQFGMPWTIKDVAADKNDDEGAGYYEYNSEPIEKRKPSRLGFSSRDIRVNNNKLRNTDDENNSFETTVPPIIKTTPKLTPASWQPLPKPAKLFEKRREKSTEAPFEDWERKALHEIDEWNKKASSFEEIKPLKEEKELYSKIKHEWKSRDTDKSAKTWYDEDQDSDDLLKTARQTVKPRQFGWRTTIKHEVPKSSARLEEEKEEKEKENKPVVKKQNQRQSRTRKNSKVLDKAPKGITTISHSFEISHGDRKPARSGSLRTSEKAKESKKIEVETTTRSAPLRTGTETSKQKQHRIGTWASSAKLVADDWSEPARLQQTEADYEDDRSQMPERIEIPESALEREDDVSSRIIESDDVTERPFERRGELLEDEKANLENNIPGSPGADYPTFSSIPRTSFDCKEQQWPGYYADVEAQCQVCVILIYNFKLPY